MFSIIAAFSLTFFIGVYDFGLQKVEKKGDTRKLLTSLESVTDDHDVLAKLFKTGDSRVSDLIEALDDRDPKVSLRAQIVIRYLGNLTGMKAFNVWHHNQAKTIESGPIPLPLSERDYEFIRVTYLENPSSQWFWTDKYIYALALDGSRRAKDVLKEVIEHAGSIDESTVTGQAIANVLAGKPDKALTNQVDLASMVFKNAFFIDPADRKYASFKTLALNGPEDKALVELHINRGPLSEEWYHVVISKHGRNWKFFSITQVAIS